MENKTVKIKETFFVTHDVKGFRFDKPEGLTFTPGQAAEVSINKPKWKDEGRPFTFTSLPNENHMEFIIKTYPSHEGVTNELQNVKENDELILHDVFGAIEYKGPGIFIAGGAGITPFISIFRQLKKDGDVKGNMLIFGNKTSKDIILKDEFTDLLGDDFINILSDEKAEGYDHGMVDENYIKKHMEDHHRYFYVCGPPPMMKAVPAALKKLGITDDNIVTEEW